MRWFNIVGRRWAYLLVLSPLVTDWIEVHHLPHALPEFTTEVVVGLIILIGVRIIYRDMDRLRAIAETDALTGLFNRRKFMDDLSRQIEIAHRLTTPLALVYLDVDDFKGVNDAYGHTEGDKVLRQVAQLLRNCARREIDACYRLGGDEFAVLLVGVNEAGATDMIRRASSADGPAQTYLRSLDVTLSFGTAELQPQETLRGFLHRADHGMYRCKRGAIQHRIAPGGPPAGMRGPAAARPVADGGFR